MTKNIPEENENTFKRKMDFSPGRRDIEYKLARIYVKKINNLDLPEKEKDSMKKTIKEFLIHYESEYKRYYQAFEFYFLPPPHLG